MRSTRDAVERRAATDIARTRGFLASPRPLLHMRVLDFRNIQFNENVLGFYLVCIYALIIVPLRGWKSSNIWEQR